MLLVVMAKIQSESAKGMISAPANGHPSIAPVPNQIMALTVLGPPRWSMNAVNPSVEVYIAKDDGKNADDAKKRPGLNATIIK